MQSLRARAIQTVLVTFGALTFFICAFLAVLAGVGVTRDLGGRADVISRALVESAEVSVGARAQNRALVERGLAWLTDVDDLVYVMALTPEGKPIGGVTPKGKMDALELERYAAREPGLLEVRHERALATRESEPAAGVGADPLEAIAAETQTERAADPRVRILLSGNARVIRQVVPVGITGLALGVIALLSLTRLTRITFDRLDPALEQARRMAQGDFSMALTEADYKELQALFQALDRISTSLSGTLSDVRGLGDEVTTAVDRIRGLAGTLRGGADQGTRAVAVTESAVAAMAKGVEESARRLADLATTADASSRDTETIEKTNAATGDAVLTLRGEVDRHARSLNVIGDRARALSRDARAVGEASDAARAAALRMQRMSVEGTERAREAARLADGAMRDSTSGGKAIEDAVTRIQDMARLAATMEGNLRALTERVEGMNPVLSAIADVTSRTSLLALNAGIIAAQAGERGAAFQVVVDELKALAGRTAQLTSTVEESVRTVLEQRGRTDEAAEALRRVVQASIEDAHRAGAALDAIRASTAQSQSVSGRIAEALTGQEQDVKETLERIDVVDSAGRSVESTAKALADEVRVLKEVADRVSAVSDEVNRASHDQGELAQRVGQVLSLVARQVRELSTAHAEQRTDVGRVERSLGEIRRFADDARAGATQLETVVERVRQKATGLADALHRFRTRG